MTIFVDTGIFAAYLSKRDKNHDRARQLVRELQKGKLGSGLTSDFIYDEASTLVLTRTKSVEIALQVETLILGDASKKIPPFISVIMINEVLFARTRELFRNYAFKGLSFTDCSSLAIMSDLKIDQILSFDSHFDGIVPRIC